MILKFDSETNDCDLLGERGPPCSIVVENWVCMETLRALSWPCRFTNVLGKIMQRLYDNHSMEII